MTDRELMYEVLEALESLHRTGDTQVFDMCAAPVLIPALRERLAQQEQCQYPDCKCATENPCLKGLAQPEQEPVACIGTNGELMWLNKPRVIYSKPQPLFTTPPQRKPLTDEEIAAGRRAPWGRGLSLDAFKAGVRFAEASHGVKGKA